MGIKKLTIEDSSLVEVTDLAANMFSRVEHAGKITKAEASFT